MSVELNMYHARYRKYRLAEIARQRRELNREHNSLIPISVLPDDILLRIFLISCEKEAKFDTIFMVTMKATSQVCSYWRNLTFGSSLHWSHISNHKGGMLWLQELLRRSKSSILNVVIKFTSGEDLEMASTILQHSSRFRELEISMDVADTAFEDQLRCMLEKPMHYLQTLTVEKRAGGSNQTLILTDAPSLHCVHLINLPISVNTSTGLSTVTELELSCDKASEGFTHALLYVIRDMHSLKSLITNSGTAPPQMTTASIPFTGNVHLPYLERMELSGTLYHCAHIALSIEIPTSCICSIICLAINNSQRSNFPLMTQAITKILESRAPEALYIDSFDYGLYVYTMDRATNLDDNSLELVFKRDTKFLDFEDVIAPFLSPFGNLFLRSVKYLQLGIQISKHKRHDDFLHNLLCSCANVQTLELIDDESIKNILRLIQTHESVGNKILPALQALVTRENKLLDAEAEEIESTIVSLIKWRCDIGLPLESIQFSRHESRNQLLKDQLTQMDSLRVIYNG